MGTPAEKDAALVFDHIGVVTGDIDAAAQTLAEALGPCGFSHRFDDEALGVSVRFVKDRSGLVYEMISPLGEKSPVARTLASKASLLNQVAYRTEALDTSARALRAGRCLPVSRPAPAKAFGGALVQFFWNPLGFVVELIESPAHTHLFLDSFADAK